ncbi:hypothetical protein HPB47_007170 [Ixodes persulcatus]|uniref:Uncharacterized protein n=1 Tax=Ixodes persulcatus TaxID=34615 RepID=A0AC60P8B4_IXOPE|nr:hypothetical protein HPB47_007170 [Ixodes persulcatus]
MVRACVTCQQFSATPTSVPTGPLPDARRTRTEHFEVVCADIADPLYVRARTSHAYSYVALFTIIDHVYESYKGRDKEWESQEQPFVLLSHWSGKVLTKMTASETTDVVEFIADTLKTIKRAMQYKHHIEATYIHCLATDVLRYRLITVDTVDSWK